MHNSILMTLVLPNSIKNEVEEEVREMHLLANTLSYDIVEDIYQNAYKIDSSTFFGKGKIQEVLDKIDVLSIDTVFINNELSPSHYKNIQKIFTKKIYVIDRTKLILDIFKTHARTSESKKQIRLAMLEYLLPRLVGRWTHLASQIGGTGIRGGPGEKQVEIDRRLARNEITKLKKELVKIQKQRDTQRKNRDNIFKVSLVGYTNSGKSTLLRTLSGYNAFVKDQLFATLDTTTKKINLSNKSTVLVSDTVGFLRNLPHKLIASFRSTLSDIENSNLIVKVIDINASDIEGHITTINNTLKQLGCEKKNSIMVFNKIDLVEDDSKFVSINKKYKGSILISAFKNIRIQTLINEFENYATKGLYEYELKIPYQHISIINDIYENMIVQKRKDGYKFITFNVKASKQAFNKVKSLL